MNSVCIKKRYLMEIVRFVKRKLSIELLLNYFPIAVLSVTKKLNELFSLTLDIILTNF